MLLTHEDVELFFKLHRTLMIFVNQRLHVLPEEISTPEAFAARSDDDRFKVRQAFLDEVDLIEFFVDQNPAKLPEDELEIVYSWRQLVAGKFYLFRDLKKYTVFLSGVEPPVAYGVLALTQPFEQIFGPWRPQLIETVLLPFKDQIVYDSFLVGPGPSLVLGPGIRRSLNESYQRSKDRLGIVTSLPITATAVELPTKPKAKSRPKLKSKDAAAAVLKVVLALIDEFCREHLNEEYAQLCRNLAEKLARERPSPLVSGKPNTWACGIVRTIGWVNYLDDKSQTPHMKMTAIDKAFGVGESTGQGKSMLIRKMLRIKPMMDPKWSLRSRLDKNPLAWMIQVNGFFVDARFLKREIQEEALRQGLIPYIPDRPATLHEGDDDEDE